MAFQVAPNVETLRKEIQEKYTEVAISPELEFHFHHGRPLAKILEYPDELLEGLPDEAVESFAGVGNPFSLGEIALGETVVEIGSGSGRRGERPQLRDHGGKYPGREALI